MAKTKQELEKEFEAYKVAAEEKEKTLKKRLLLCERTNSEANEINSRLIEDKKELQLKYDEIVAGYDKLYKENEHLRKEVQELDSENATLNMEYTSLQEENALIRSENERLENELERVKREATEYYPSLTKTFHDVFKEYVNVKRDCEVTHKIVEELQNKRDELMKENEELKKELEAEKAKSKPIPLPPRPDFPALLKRYADLQKEKEQLDKDFKDLYGRYEKQLNKNNHLTQAMSSIIAGLEMLKHEKEKLLKENEVLKTELEAKQYYIENLEAQVVFEEIVFGKTGITINDVMDILNAWWVINDRLELVEEGYCDTEMKKITRRQYIAIDGKRKHISDKDAGTIAKAMGIKSCQ